MKAFLLPLALMLVSGCASVTHGTTQEIPIVTNPPGALATVTGINECRTPCTLTLPRKNDCVLAISKEGYEAKNVPLNSVTSGTVAGNIVAGGLIGWGIDAASGAAYHLVPERVDVQLTPIESHPPTLAELFKEIDDMKAKGLISESDQEKMKSEFLQDRYKKTKP